MRYLFTAIFIAIFALLWVAQSWAKVEPETKQTT